MVTNDDGIGSEGLQVLARALESAGHEVVVVAPDGEHSGFGAALGDLGPGASLPSRRVVIDGFAGDAWAMAGPPALTVLAARLGAFGDPPDLVVSGPNAGLNTGRTVLHSGTVGAALTGQNFGISGLAVSLERAAGPDGEVMWHWDTAAALTLEVLPWVLDAPARSVLNLNVPGRPRSDVHGLRWARLAAFGAVRARLAVRSDEGVVFELAPSEGSPPPDSDQGTVDAGYAAVTALVGVVEAWPAADAFDGELGVALVPGADLHPVHRVPDPAEHNLRPHPSAPTESSTES